MIPEFVPEARLELLEAYDYYESIQQGLGSQFEEQVEQCLRNIAYQPNLLSQRGGGYRRANLRRFPYYLPYVNKGELCWVLAVAHAARQPGYWKDRRPPL